MVVKSKITTNLKNISLEDKRNTQYHEKILSNKKKFQISRRI